MRFGSVFEAWRRRRDRRETAQAVDNALSGAVAAPEEFARGVDVGRSLSADGWFDTAAEPPHDALVALRAGLALRQKRRTRPEKRRIAVVLATTAGVAAAIGAVTMVNQSGPPTTFAEAQQSLGNLSRHVKSLQSALESGDQAKVQTEIVAAQAAADEAEAVVQQLPNAPERALAVEATNQRVQDVQWLVEKARQSFAHQPSPVQLVTTTTTAAPTTTTTALASTSTTQAPPPETTSTTTPSTSTTAPPTTTTTSTTTPPESTTTTPSTSTTQPPHTKPTAPPN